MARSDTTVTERIPMTLQTRVVELIEKEAALMKFDRTKFIRTLIAKAMGHLHVMRAPDAPNRRPLSAPKSKLEVTRLDLWVTQDAKEWLTEMKKRSGGVTMAGLITLMVLEWADINPLRGSVFH